MDLVTLRHIQSFENELYDRFAIEKNSISNRYTFHPISVFIPFNSDNPYHHFLQKITEYIFWISQEINISRSFFKS